MNRTITVFSVIKNLPELKLTEVVHSPGRNFVHEPGHRWYSFRLDHTLDLHHASTLSHLPSSSLAIHLQR